MALKIPSQRSIDLYNQLVAQQNKVRKQLIRIHKNAEEASGAGRLPALVIPKNAHKTTRDRFYGLSKSELQKRLKAFYQRYNEAKRLFGQGLRSYIARTVKQGYMELWRDQILFIGGEAPQGQFNMFTKEQIENSFVGEFMETYNKLNRLSAEVFLGLLYSGRIIQFKYIYAEMIGNGNKEYSWLDQQNDNLVGMSSKKAQIELMNLMAGVEGKHQKKTIKKAEEAEEENIRRQERRKR